MIWLINVVWFLVIQFYLNDTKRKDKAWAEIAQKFENEGG